MKERIINFTKNEVHNTGIVRVIDETDAVDLIYPLSDFCIHIELINFY